MRGNRFYPEFEVVQGRRQLWVFCRRPIFFIMKSKVLHTAVGYLLREASQLSPQQWGQLPREFHREIHRLADLMPGVFFEPEPLDFAGTFPEMPLDLEAQMQTRRDHE